MTEYHAPSTTYEWAVILIRLAAAVLCARLGMWTSGRSVRTRNGAGCAAGIVIAAGTVSQLGTLQYRLGPGFAPLGGEGAAICLAAFFLLGIALRAPERRVRAPFVGALFAVGAAAYLSLIFSPLAWRYLGADLRQNTPTDKGFLWQQTSVTCSPASAAMLLYRYGIRTSEGDMAQLAGTRPHAGTAEYPLYRAIDRAARLKGLRGRIGRVSYPEARSLARPFIAYIDHPEYGPHTVLVTHIEGDRVHVLDPLTADERPTPRKEFEKQWDHVAVWIQTTAGGSSERSDPGSAASRHR